MAQIKVSRVQHLTTGSSLKAFCSVELGPLTINDVKVIQQPGKEPWVAMPSREYQDGEGNRKFAPVVEIADGSLKDDLTQAVLAAWKSQAGSEAPEGGDNPAPPPKTPQAAPVPPQQAEIRRMIEAGVLDKEALTAIRREVGFPKSDQATKEDWDRLLLACKEAVEGDDDPFAGE